MEERESSQPKSQQKRNILISQLKAQMKNKLQTRKKSLSMPGNIISLNQASEQFQINQKNKMPESFQQFNQKYELREKIGEGRNGVVYKCWHKQKQKMYAVKLIRFQLEHIAYLKESFYYLAEITHENIIEYRSIYLHPKKKQAYLVTQLFEHPPLCNFEKKLNETQLKTIAHDILDGLSYLHRKGICHRDIKPDNILYDEKNNKIKIIDFGVCKKFKFLNFRREMMTTTGTQVYKAPEMLKVGTYTELIDLWAAGITIYKLITGVTPFQSKYITKINENILKGQINFERQIWNLYSPLAEDLISRLLKPAPQRLDAQQGKKHLWFLGYEDHTHSIKIESFQKNPNGFNWVNSLNIPNQGSHHKQIKTESWKHKMNQILVRQENWVESDQDQQIIESPFPSDN